MAQQQSREIVHYEAPRLPYNNHLQENYGVTLGQWQVLVNSIFPNAKTAGSVALAIAYCQQRKLDIFKRPVHIVPMWNSQLGRSVETIWPGISEIRTTATRAHFAGCDEAEFGPMEKKTFKGRVKEWVKPQGGGAKTEQWIDKEKTVSFPSWCRLTVYKMVQGQRVKFVGPKVLWLECYAAIGNSDIPNDMWESRPEGQLEKCAEAAALRRAFPEEVGNDLTAEEMAGRRIDDLGGGGADIIDASNQDAAPPRTIEHAPQQTDAAPPRQQAAQAQQEPETDQPDDDPPPHDSIPDGPGEDAAESDGDQPMAAQEPAQPTGPHTLDPIQGDTLKSWAKRFTDAIATSKTQAQVYEWHGMNKSGLESVKTGAPAIFEGVKREMDGTLAALRERGSTAPKAAAKPAEPQADAGPPRKTAPGPLDAQMQGAVGGPNQPKSAKPDDILKWADQRLARIDDPENLAADIEAITTLYMPLLKLPPDVDEMQGIIRNHEKRLER